MKLSTLMIIKAAVCIALGAVILIAPGWLYNLFGAPLDDAGKYAAREYGAALIGTFLLTWYARYAIDSKARRAIILDLFIYDAIGLVITLFAVINGVMNPLGWSIVALYGLLAIGYGYFWFKNPVP